MEGMYTVNAFVVAAIEYAKAERLIQLGRLQEGQKPCLSLSLPHTGPLNFVMYVGKLYSNLESLLYETNFMTAC